MSALNRSKNCAQGVCAHLQGGHAVQVHGSAFLLTQFSATRSTAARNLQKGFTGARSKDLCGRLWERSMAKETPDFFAMISRDKAQRRIFRVTRPERAR